MYQVFEGRMGVYGRISTEVPATELLSQAGFIVSFLVLVHIILFEITLSGNRADSKRG